MWTISADFSSFTDKRQQVPNCSGKSCIREPPTALSLASVQRLNFAPGMGCRRRVASAKAFLASLNACSASSVH
ncbi:hypothetical protein TNCV_1928071 [Trichonephila clavipes]|nr:hypothetical protein TNCV_1928071 [Trichonephila clavipes]